MSELKIKKKRIQKDKSFVEQIINENSNSPASPKGQSEANRPTSASPQETTEAVKPVYPSSYPQTAGAPQDASPSEDSVRFDIWDTVANTLEEHGVSEVCDLPTKVADSCRQEIAAYAQSRDFSKNSFSFEPKSCYAEISAQASALDILIQTHRANSSAYSALLRSISCHLPP
jgi:hypothetical protein